MKENEMGRRSFGLILFCLGALATACSSRSPTPVSLGPETSNSEIKSAVSEAMRESQPERLKVGSYAHWVDTESIDRSKPMVMTEIEQLIRERDIFSDPNQIKLRIQETKFVLFQKKVRKILIDRSAKIHKAAHQLFAFMPTEVIDTANSGFVYSFAVRSDFQQKLNHISLHGLQKKMTLAAPPILVQKRPACGGLKNCQMRLFEIEYDLAQWFEGRAEPDKIHFHLKISPDVPILAALLDRCQRGLATFAKQQVLVSQCSPVTDFTW